MFEGLGYDNQGIGRPKYLSNYFGGNDGGLRVLKSRLPFVDQVYLDHTQAMIEKINWRYSCGFRYRGCKAEFDTKVNARRHGWRGNGCPFNPHFSLVFEPDPDKIQIIKEVTRNQWEDEKYREWSGEEDERFFMVQVEIGGEGLELIEASSHCLSVDLKGAFDSIN